MQNKIRIVRDGVPHYVAPWFNSLSPAARKLAGRQGPMSCDPPGQLALPLPSYDMGQPQLDLQAPPGRRKKPSDLSHVMTPEQFGRLIDVQHKLYREGNKENAQALWDVLATIPPARAL